jgi:hypothetical protein
MIKTVNVTNKHIQDGVRCEANDCPVALAIMELCKPEVAVYVCFDTVVFSRNKPGDVDNWTTKNSLEEVRVYLTIRPKLGVVSKFVRDFDVGSLVEPFSFELEFPRWAVKER